MLEKEEVGKKRERDFTEESQENISETSLQERTGFFSFRVLPDDNEFFHIQQNRCLFNLLLQAQRQIRFQFRMILNRPQKVQILP